MDANFICVPQHWVIAIILRRLFQAQINILCRSSTSQHGRLISNLSMQRYFPAKAVQRDLSIVQGKSMFTLLNHKAQAMLSVDTRQFSQIKSLKSASMMLRHTLALQQYIDTLANTEIAEQGVKCDFRLSSGLIP